MPLAGRLGVPIPVANTPATWDPRHQGYTPGGGEEEGEMNGRGGRASAVGRRLRWDLTDEGLVNSRDPATMARTLMYLFGSGGILVLLTLPLAETSGLSWLGMVLPAVAA